MPPEEESERCDRGGGSMNRRLWNLGSGHNEIVGMDRARGQRNAVGRRGRIDDDRIGQDRDGKSVLSAHRPIRISSRSAAAVGNAIASQPGPAARELAVSVEDVVGG